MFTLSISDSLQLNRSSDFSTDVNECQDHTHNCHVDAQCKNSIGSFSCTCLQGYSGDGVNCSGMIYPSAAILYCLQVVKSNTNVYVDARAVFWEFLAYLVHVRRPTENTTKLQLGTQYVP